MINAFEGRNVEISGYEVRVPQPVPQACIVLWLRQPPGAVRCGHADSLRRGLLTEVSCGFLPASMHSTGRLRFFAHVLLSPVQTLEYFSLSGINKWAYVGYESLFFVGFFFAAWAALQFIRYDKR